MNGAQFLNLTRNAPVACAAARSQLVLANNLHEAAAAAHAIFLQGHARRANRKHLRKGLQFERDLIRYRRALRTGRSRKGAN
jgi:hypothetical protein